MLIFASLNENESLSEFLFDEPNSFKSPKRILEKSLANKLIIYTLQNFYDYQLNTLPHITKNEYGKPFFSDQSFPKYNISHSKDLLVIAFSDKEIGVDLEYVNLNRNIKSIAKRFFTEDENSFINRNNEFYDKRFYLIWVLTEAMSKFIGKGFSSFNKEFSIELNANNNIFVNNNEFIDNVYVGSIELDKHTYMFSYISEQRELPKLYYFKDNKITSISQHENLKNKTECCNLKDYLSKNKI